MAAAHITGHRDGRTLVSIPLNDTLLQLPFGASGPMDPRAVLVDVVLQHLGLCIIRDEHPCAADEASVGGPRATGPQGRGPGVGKRKAPRATAQHGCLDVVRGLRYSRCGVQSMRGVSSRAGVHNTSGARYGIDPF